jgi:hypothetical protein
MRPIIPLGLPLGMSFAPLFALPLLLLLAGCATGDPAPDWKIRAFAATEQATQNYLLGRTRAAEKSADLAIQELSKTGQPAQVAQAQLVFCAVRVASLNFDDCPGFKDYFADATQAQRAYYAYLTGRLTGPQSGPQYDLLPAQHQPVVLAAASLAASASSPQALIQAVQKIDDPVSRLVAAGALVRVYQGQFNNPSFPSLQLIQAAVDTASDQGWPQPLAAWLALQARVARQLGDRQLEATARRRLEVVLQR